MGARWLLQAPLSSVATGIRSRAPTHARPAPTGVNDTDSGAPDVRPRRDPVYYLVSHRTDSNEREANAVSMGEGASGPPVESALAGFPVDPSRDLLLEPILRPGRRRSMTVSVPTPDHRRVEDRRAGEQHRRLVRQVDAHAVRARPARTAHYGPGHHVVRVAPRCRHPAPCASRSRHPPAQRA